MFTSKLKKGLSLILSILMIFSMVPTTLFALGADDSYPTMMQFTAASSADFHKYYNQVYSVTFLDKIDADAMAGAIENWDISQNKDGSVMGWMYLNDEATAAAGANRYDVYIAGEGGVGANPNSGFIFYMFDKLERINNPENFKTGNVTTLKFLFYGCYALEEVDFSSWDVSNVTSLERMFYRCYGLKYANLSGWDTSNVTSMYGMFEMTPPTNVSPDYSLEKVDFTGWNTSKVTTMENMFKNCEALKELDLSSFDTSKVTTMRFMFYYCKSLKNIYVGDGWTTEAIANINDGVFNCCYALVGGKDNMDENISIYNDKHPSAYYPPDSRYAKTKEEGGYLTDISEKPQPEKKKYTVTYEFTGDIIPDGVTAPTDSVYEEGSTVAVEANPAADGYIFSGWSTDDATVENGEFVINNDVHFVGSWEKLYNVYYKYTSGYPIPTDAPDASMLTLLSSEQRAGDDVSVAGVMFANGYIFVGWYTEDADIVGDNFTMPEKDVTLYGYFKKPVESVEFLETEHIVLNKGDDDKKLSVYVKPEDATVKDIIFESSDESVVKVDKYGNIETVGEGTATITVKSADDPTKSDTIEVTVKIPATDITVDKTDITIRTDGTDKITATVNPDATNKDVTYTSGDENIVKVDENGNITPVGEGTTTITVTSKDDPDVKEVITVTVKNPVTEITATEDFTVEVGDSKNLDAKVNDDATNKELIYESKDPGVAKVDSEGNVIAVGEGTTTITIISKDDPTITQEVIITVTPKMYKVTYEYIGSVRPENEPAVPGEKRYEAGSTVDVELDAYVEGYTFSGWSTDDATVENGEFVINNDVHFVGSWEKLYSVTYEYEGEVPVSAPVPPSEETYTADEIVDVKDAPTVDGYTFVGWTEPAGVTVTDGKFTMPAEDVVFKGKFEKILKDYNVTYKYVGNVPADAPEVPGKTTHKESTTVTVENTPSLEGYTFSGWTTVDATVEDGEFTMPAKDVELVGSWTKILKDYNVTYKYVGDVPADAPEVPAKTTHKESTTVTVENAPSLEGYTFSGWTTVDATVEDGEFTMPAKDVELVGSWTKIPVGDITVNKSTIELTEGDTEKITITVTPENALDKEVIITSSDETVVKVDEDGEITAVGEGTAIITITSKDDPTIKEKVTVTVKKPVKKYNVTYKYDGEVPEKAPAVPDDAAYEAGKTVNIATNPTLDGYVFSGWVREGTTEKVDKFTMPTKDVVIKGSWMQKITIVLGEEHNISEYVDLDTIGGNLTFISDREVVATIDANGNITTNSEGQAYIYISSKTGVSKVVLIEVVSQPEMLNKHYMVFGKTEKIGWYSVSFDGGETFQVVFGNSNHVVEHGSEVIIKANDVFGDPFTFYINGKAVTPDENGYVRVTVDKYVLVGALGIPVIAPDGYESLNWIQQIIKTIKEFFAKIASWFKK